MYMIPLIRYSNKQRGDSVVLWINTFNQELVVAVERSLNKGKIIFDFSKNELLHQVIMIVDLTPTILSPTEISGIPTDPPPHRLTEALP